MQRMASPICTAWLDHPTATLAIVSRVAGLKRKLTRLAICVFKSEVYVGSAPPLQTFNPLLAIPKAAAHYR